MPSELSGARRVAPHQTREYPILASRELRWKNRPVVTAKATGRSHLTVASLQDTATPGTAAVRCPNRPTKQHCCSHAMKTRSCLKHQTRCLKQHIRCSIPWPQEKNTVWAHSGPVSAAAKTRKHTNKNSRGRVRRSLLGSAPVAGT